MSGPRQPRGDARPATQAAPDVGGSGVVSIRKVVDFPAPLGPRKATNSPAATSMSTPLTASDGFLLADEVPSQPFCVDHQVFIAPPELRTPYWIRITYTVRR